MRQKWLQKCIKSASNTKIDTTVAEKYYKNTTKIAQALRIHQKHPKEMHKQYKNSSKGAPKIAEKQIRK